MLLESTLIDKAMNEVHLQNLISVAEESRYHHIRYELECQEHELDCDPSRMLSL